MPSFNSILKQHLQNFTPMCMCVCVCAFRSNVMCARDTIYSTIWQRHNTVYFHFLSHFFHSIKIKDTAKRESEKESQRAKVSQCKRERQCMMATLTQTYEWCAQPKMSSPKIKFYTCNNNHILER